MWDSVYMTPESSGIAMALLRHVVLDIRRQSSKAVEHISLPTPTAFPACKENIGQIEDRLAAFNLWQDPDESE